MSDLADLSVPRTADELDDAWATAILRGSGAITATEDVTVTGREGVGVGAAFACELYRLHLHGPESAPEALVVKLPVTGEVRGMLDAIGAYNREVLFYRDLAPHVPIRTPRIFAAAQAADSSDFVIAMEDLAAYQGVSQTEGLSLDQAHSIVEALAHFHAWSWENVTLLEGYAKSFWPLLSEPGKALQHQYGQLFGMVWGMRGDALAELLGPDAARVAEQFAAVQPRLLQELAGPRAITHGELRAENLFFDGDEAVFIDFQLVQQESGIRELAYLLATSVRPEILEQHEDDLIRRYCDALGGKIAYAYDQARNQYRLAAAYNLLFPVMANIRWEASSERGRAVLEDMVRCVGAAAERNDCGAILSSTVAG